MSTDRLLAVRGIPVLASVYFSYTVSELLKSLSGSQQKQEEETFIIFIREFSELFPASLLPRIFASIGDTQGFDKTFKIPLTPRTETAFMVKQLTFQLLSILMLKSNPANVQNYKQLLMSSPMLMYFEHLRKRSPTLSFKLLSRPEMMSLVLTETAASDDIFSLFICELFDLYYQAEFNLLANIDEIEDISLAVDHKIGKLYPKACGFLEYYREVSVSEDEKKETASKIREITEQKSSNNSVDCITRVLEDTLVKEWSFKNGVCIFLDKEPRCVLNRLYKIVLEIDCLSLLSSSESLKGVQSLRFLQVMQYLYSAKFQYNSIFSDDGQIKLHLKNSNTVKFLTQNSLDFFTTNLDVNSIIKVITQKGINSNLKSALEGLFLNLSLAVSSIEAHIEEHKKFPIAWLTYMISFVESLRKTHLTSIGYITVRLVCLLADQYVLAGEPRKALDMLKGFKNNKRELLTGALCLKIAEIAANQNLTDTIIEIEHACKALEVRYYNPKTANATVNMLNKNGIKVGFLLHRELIR